MPDKHIQTEWEEHGRKRSAREFGADAWSTSSDRQSQQASESSSQKIPCAGKGCRKEWKNKSDYKRHFEEVHERRQEHVCMRCGNHFGRKSSLTTHLKKKFECKPREIDERESLQQSSNSTLPSAVAESSVARRSSQTTGEERPDLKHNDSNGDWDAMLRKVHTMEQSMNHYKTEIESLRQENHKLRQGQHNLEEKNRKMAEEVKEVKNRFDGDILTSVGSAIGDYQQLPGVAFGRDGDPVGSNLSVNPSLSPAPSADDTIDPKLTLLRPEGNYLLASHQDKFQPEGDPDFTGRLAALSQGSEGHNTRSRTFITRNATGNVARLNLGAVDSIMDNARYNAPP